MDLHQRTLYLSVVDTDKTALSVKKILKHDGKEEAVCISDFVDNVYLARINTPIYDEVHSLLAIKKCFYDLVPQLLRLTYEDVTSLSE